MSEIEQKTVLVAMFGMKKLFFFFFLFFVIWDFFSLSSFSSHVSDFVIVKQLFSFFILSLFPFFLERGDVMVIVDNRHLFLLVSLSCFFVCHVYMFMVK